MINKDKEDLLTQEKLKELLDYDPDTGLFTWKERVGSGRDKWFNVMFAGKMAGSKKTDIKLKHYKTINVKINLNKKRYAFLAHRLAWLYMTGKWPDKQIDHINGDSTDNRWFNLRNITGSENCRNKKINNNNKSGFTGVYWRKDANKWRAAIKTHGKKISLGCFTDKQDAIDARKEANIKYGFHENHGHK